MSLPQETAPPAVPTPSSPCGTWRGRSCSPSSDSGRPASQRALRRAGLLRARKEPPPGGPPLANTFVARLASILYLVQPARRHPRRQLRLLVERGEMTPPLDGGPRRAWRQSVKRRRSRCGGARSHSRARLCMGPASQRGAATSQPQHGVSSPRPRDVRFQLRKPCRGRQLRRWRRRRLARCELR